MKKKYLLYIFSALIVLSIFIYSCIPISYSRIIPRMIDNARRTHHIDSSWNVALDYNSDYIAMLFFDNSAESDDYAFTVYRSFNRRWEKYRYFFDKYPSVCGGFSGYGDCYNDILAIDKIDDAAILFSLNRNCYEYVTYTTKSGDEKTLSTGAQAFIFILEDYVYGSAGYADN